MIDGDSIARATYHSQPNCSVAPHNLQDQGRIALGNWQPRLPRLAKNCSAWHEYAVEYSPTSAKFFVDGIETLNVPDCSAGYSDKHCGRFFDVPYFLILNTAIGGFWPQEPDAATEFPGYHRVDWVRVAQRSDASK